MNKIKKLAVVMAAMVLTATFASAQQGFTGTATAGPLNFSLSVAMVGDITFTATTTANSTGVNASEGILMSSSSYSVGDIKKVGTIKVATNMGSWDVLVDSRNNGVLTQQFPEVGVEPILKNASTGNDVKVIVNVCALKGNDDAMDTNDEALCTTAGAAYRVGINAATDFSSGNSAAINNRSAGQLPNLDGQSIAEVLKANAKFLAADGDDDGVVAAGSVATYIPVYAYVNAQKTDLVGNGTFTEALTFTLISGY